MKELKFTTLRELEQVAFVIDSALLVRYPQTNQQRYLNPYVDKKLEAGYCTNNGMVSFVSNGKFYVIPYMRKVINVLSQNGFTEKSINVPFSNMDYPMDDKLLYYLEYLKAAAYEQSIQDFKEDCENFADSHGFKTIDKSLLEQCFEIPGRGIRVKLHNSIGVYLPIIQHQVFGAQAERNIGRYATNNGITVFVYFNGKTYVTSNPKVLSALTEAGYTPGVLPVPFSNFEKVLDSEYEAQLKRLEIC